MKGVWVVTRAGGDFGQFWIYPEDQQMEAMVEHAPSSMTFVPFGTEVRATVRAK